MDVDTGGAGFNVGVVVGPQAAKVITANPRIVNSVVFIIFLA